MLEAFGLGFAHRGAPPLFRGLSLAVRPNEIVVLLGASGCGKSSLLRVLAGLEAPVEGRIRLAGQPLNQPHPRAALLFQQPSLLPWLRVADNVAFGLDFHHQPRLPTALRRDRVATALGAVGLIGAARLWPAQLSGGMAQRAALARALAREPLLLFADEPFSALDAVTRSDMQTLLLDVVRRFSMAVLLVTHDIDEALALGDRVLLMGQGRFAAEWVLPAAPAERRARHATLRGELLDALHQVRDPRRPRPTAPPSRIDYASA